MSDKKIVKAGVRAPKKTLGEDIRDTFQLSDLGTVKDYLVTDVIIPKVKNTVWSLITEGASAFLYNKSAPPRTGTTVRSSISGGPVITNYATSRNNPGRVISAGGVGNRYSQINAIRLESKEDADNVLDELYSDLQEYQRVTVFSYYQLLGISVEPNDKKFGWTDLGGTKIVPRDDGTWSIVLPKVVELK